MPKYEFRVDKKFTIWGQEFIKIDAATFDKALEIAKLYSEDLEESGQVDSNDFEYIFDSSEDFSVEENDGQPTIEIYYDPDQLERSSSPLYDNVNGIDMAERIKIRSLENYDASFALCDPADHYYELDNSNLGKLICRKCGHVKFA